MQRHPVPQPLLVRRQVQVHRQLQLRSQTSSAPSPAQVVDGAEVLVLVLEPVLAALPLVRARAVQVAVTSSAHSPAQEAVGVVQLAPVRIGALPLLHVPLCAFGHT